MSGKWAIMDWDEVKRIVALMIRFDPRVGNSEDDLQGWQIGLGGLDPGRCREAVALHYRSSTERIMPAHIRALARTTTDGQAPAAAAPPGEILCDRCAGVHRPSEACEALTARPFPRPLGSVARALTAVPESASEAARERALQRARGEGDVPWRAPVEAPDPEPYGARPVEERDYEHRAGVITAEDAPPPGMAASTCLACRPGLSGSRPVFLDYPAGRSAHRAMFGHDPQARPGVGVGDGGRD